MKLIKHIIEPEELLLTWQAPTGPDRMRRFVAELQRTADDCRLKYLSDASDYDAALRLGFTGYPGFDKSVQTHDHALDAFMKRLPPRSRRDFPKFLASFCLPADSQISDFALLGYSGAKLPDDDFCIICPFLNAHPPFEFLIRVQAFPLYFKQLPSGLLGEKVSMVPEPNNPFDPDAIRVEIQGAMAGFIPRGLNTQMLNWLQLGYQFQATVERTNDSLEWPSLSVFLEIRENAHSEAAA